MPTCKALTATARALPQPVDERAVDEKRVDTLVALLVFHARSDQLLDSHLHVHRLGRAFAAGDARVCPKSRDVRA
jgi:hypothetical protein